MPRCEGRPNEGCPAKANNSSVNLSQGDLMSCKDCEIFRFPGLAPKCTTTEGRTLPSASSSSTVTAIDETSADSCEHSELIVNELLFFVFNKYDNNCTTAIQSTILNFYRKDEIMAAKQVILQNVDNSLMSVIQPHFRKRIL